MLVKFKLWVKSWCRMHVYIAIASPHNNREDNLVSQKQQQSVGARIHKVGHWCGREINKKKEERRKKSLPDPKKERATAIILTLCMLSTLSPIQYLYDVFRLYTKKSMYTHKIKIVRKKKLTFIFFISFLLSLKIRDETGKREKSNIEHRFLLVF